MAQILPTSGKCPHCEKVISGYSPAARDYGTPIRTCRNCNQQYLDSRFIELAVEEPAPRDLSVSTGLKVILLGAIGLIASLGLTLFSLSSRGVYSPKMIVVSAFSVFLIIYGIVDAIRVKTGAKMKSLDRKRYESEQRLMDKAYAYQLRELGYDVPEKYL